MLIDTHAHVNFRAFQDDAEDTLRQALQKDVWVVNVGSQIDTSRQAVELAKKFETGIYAAVGLHPEHTHSQFVDEEETHFKTREEEFNYEEYKKLAAHPKVVGIGECGLDYYRLPEGLEREKVKNLQHKAFISQIRLAKELNKTLVIHSRSTKGTDNAGLDILEILKSQISNSKFPIRFVLHSYTGSPDVLQEFIGLGAYVSFNGIITFDKTGNMEKLVQITPMEKLVLETDCPYLSPVPHRGKRNEPANVKLVAEKLSVLKDLSLQEVENVTTINAKTLFNLS